MKNSPAEKKSPTRLRTSTPLLFFLSFLLIFLVFLFCTTEKLHLLLSPSISRYYFSLRTSFPAPAPVSPTVSTPVIDLGGSPSSGQTNETKIVDTQIPIASGSALKVDGDSTDNDTSSGLSADGEGHSVSKDSEITDNGDGSSVALNPLEASEMKDAGVVMRERSKESKADMSGFSGGSLKLKGCNLHMGKWVRDESGGYPLYSPGSCPYVDEAFACQGNGRPDSGYLRWKWKPESCELPRFDAADFLERLRNKRMMLVGDSMNRNQFESMLCLLREGLADKNRMYETHGFKITKGRGYYVFKFVDYNCTVEFVRSHFLVREGIRINGQGHSNPTLSIDTIDKSSGKWKRADILIFNTGHWWTHGKTSRGKNYFKEGDEVYPQFDAVEAYRRSLKTWGKWIDENIDPSKQLIFYRGYSSAHFRGGDWDSGGTCNGETEPLSGGALLDSYPMKMKIVEEVIQQMHVPVLLLNVTRLTNFRKDGHPSIYGKNATAGVRVSRRKQDCSHWCLPGVPDAWNELIYATLVYNQTPPN